MPKTTNPTTQLTLQSLFSPNCKVNDLVFPTSRVIFVLESPHTTEVSKGYPAAGKSGVDMTRLLIRNGLTKCKSDNALGNLIFNKRIKKFGIMNVCNYPMQSLTQSAFIRHIRDNIKSSSDLRKILRKVTPINIQNPGIIQSLTLEILTSLSERMSQVGESNQAIFVPCGDFARAFIEYIVLDLEYNYNIRSVYPLWSRCIPHPSNGRWLRDNEQLDKMCNSIKKLPKPI